MPIDIYGLVTWWESHCHLHTATSPITAGLVLALESHHRLLSKWTNLSWMGFLALWASKHYCIKLKTAAEWACMALFSVNCTCTLPETPKEVVFMDNGHFVPLSAVDSYKDFIFSLLSTYFCSFSPLSFGCFYFHIALADSFRDECRSQRQSLYSGQADERDHLSVSTREGQRCGLTPD